MNTDTGRIITVLIIATIIVGVLAPSYNSIRKVNAITGGVGDPTGEMELPTGSSLFGSSLSVNQANNNDFTKSAADSVIATIPVGAGPYGAVYDPDNDRIYVANYDGGSVSVIEAKTNKVVANISDVGVNPRELAYNSNNGLIYVANTFFGQPSGTVAVINPKTNEVIKVISESIGRQPTGITYDSIHNKLYVANQIENFVSVIDGSTNKVIKTIDGIQNPYTDVFNPHNGKVYVTTALGVNTVFVIDPVTDTVIKSIPVGSDPIFAAYSSFNHDIYVANQFSHNVYVIDDETNEVTDIISAGDRPVGVAHNPNNNRIYVTNSASDDVTIINGSTNEVIDTIASGGDTPATPVFSPINNFIYVTNQLSNNVAVIATSGGLPTPAQQIQQLIDSIENNNQISERAKSHLANKLDKALSALADEASPTNNKKITCKILNSALSSVAALQKSKQISPALAAEIGQQITSIMNNLKC